MSKRFGRQQKRKLQQRIRDLEMAHQMDRGLMDHMREKIGRYERTIERTARVLGEYFVTLDPAEIELRSLNKLADEWRVEHINYSHHRSSFSVASASDFVEKAMIEIQLLPVLKCESFLDSLHGALHFRFTFNGKQAGYAISQSAIMQQPGFKEASRRNVAEAVTRAFMDTEVPTR